MIDNTLLYRLARLVQGHEKVSAFQSDPASPVSLSTTRAAIQIGYVSGGETLGFVPPGYGNLRQIHLDISNVAGGPTQATVEIAKGTSAAGSVVVTDSITANLVQNVTAGTYAVNIAFSPNPIWKDDDEYYYALVTLDQGTADATATLIANCFTRATTIG